MDNIKADAPEGRVIVGIRPEEFCVSKDPSRGFKSHISKSTYLGKYVIYFVDIKGVECPKGEDDSEDVFEISQDLGTATSLLKVGDDVSFEVYPHKINVFDVASGVSLIEGTSHEE